MDSLTDGELLDAFREGQQDAYGVLFNRYKDTALQVARRQTPDPHLAEDAVNEAFAAILAAIQNGSGPVGFFGPYLFSSVARRAYRMNRRSMREIPVAGHQQTHAPNFTVADFDTAAVRRAYRSLPQRWQQVLWHLDINAMYPREAAPMLGLSPNAVVALHRRAKDGLRLAFLKQQVNTNNTECQHMAVHIPAYALGTLRKSLRTTLEAHFDACRACAWVNQQIQDVGGMLPRTHAAVPPNRTIST
jgi:RNA polymerase sigma factor (sigma-70 family)